MGGVLGGAIATGEMPKVDINLAKKTATAALDFLGVGVIAKGASTLEQLSNGDSGPKPCWT